MKGFLPFNEWSRERILAGRKSLTSRHKKYLHDPLVQRILPFPWHHIRDIYYRQEGADSPEELQRVIEEIQHRPVPDDELFYTHFFDNKKMQERLRGG